MWAICDNGLAKAYPQFPYPFDGISKLFGNGPELWIDLQRAYDLATVGEALADELARIPTLRVA